MLKSMTGYGSAAANELGCEFSLEIRSVNHRYLDCNIRAPRVLSFVEETIKTAVSARLARGKVDVFLNVDMKGAELVRISLNKPIAASYLRAINEMRDEFGLRGEPDIALMSRMPDVFTVEREQLDAEAVCGVSAKLVNSAIDELEAMRAREGERLCKSILSGADCIEELVREVEESSPRVVAEYQTKLETRLREFLAGATVDEARMLTEVALFADKVANNEELVRLRSHLTELRALLNSGGAQGRKVDFLIQEINREANTIGSKGNDAHLSHIVVDIKSEIEKIREQVQNLE